MNRMLDEKEERSIRNRRGIRILDFPQRVSINSRISTGAGESNCRVPALS